MRHDRFDSCSLTALRASGPRRHHRWHGPRKIDHAGFFLRRIYGCSLDPRASIFWMRLRHAASQFPINAARGRRGRKCRLRSFSPRLCKPAESAPERTSFHRSGDREPSQTRVITRQRRPRKRGNSKFSFCKSGTDERAVTYADEAQMSVTS